MDWLFGGGRHRRDEAVPFWVDNLNRKLDRILRHLESNMATMQDLQDAVARNTDAEDSVITLLRGIAQQLKDARGDQAAIDKLVADMEASTSKLGAAVVENTPQA